jgi:hypothetical protein
MARDLSVTDQAVGKCSSFHKDCFHVTHPGKNKLSIQANQVSPDRVSDCDALRQGT